MAYVIGIDVGGSTTKIVGFSGESMVGPIFVKANDPIASVYGAFGRFVAENSIALSDIEKIMITGVGASFIKENLFGISTAHVEEFIALGLGGLYISSQAKAIIVSMGTGTAFVRAGENIEHLGGTGVGGGTLLGLSKKMLQISSFDDISEIAKTGDLDKIDLYMKDITSGEVSNLLPTTTASNFGKLSDFADKSDIALGIVNMVFQTIGMMAVFCTNDRTEKVVLTGTMTRLAFAKEIFADIAKITGVEFIIPQNAEFATAAGAALVYRRGFRFKDIVD